MGTAVLLLAGCGGEPEPDRLPAEEFHRLAGELDSFSQASDQSLDDLGTATCGVLAAHSDDDAWLQAVAMFTQHEPPIDAGDAGSFIAYAVGRHCPDERAKLPS